MSLLQLILAALAPAATQNVSVERIDETSFRMTIAAPPASTVEALRRRLLPAARLACQKQRPVFARYRVSAEEPGKAAAMLEQELICAATLLRPNAAATTPNPSWSPAPADQQELLAATYAYFFAKDAGRYAEAHGFLSDSMKAATPLPAWADAARMFNAEAGPARGRRVVEISWYNHPADAPEPGIYVAADFSAEFEQLEFVCGYVMWRLLPDGSFRLVREEQNLARKRGSRPLAAIDRAPMRTRMGCKD